MKEEIQKISINKTVIMTKMPESFGYFKIQSGQL
jgi:hypothetical protein